MNIGKSIREIRESKGHTSMRKFAKANGFDQSYLCRIERSHKVPKMPYLEKIAAALGVPVSIIVYKATEESDVAPDKIVAYRLLKPSIDELVNESFLKKE